MIERPKIGDTPDSFPSLKIGAKIGDETVVMIADATEIPDLEFGTNAPKLNKQGKPKTQVKLTAIVLDARDGVMGKKGEEETPEVGTVVNLYLSSYRKWEYIQGLKKFGVQRPTCGDVMLWAYEKDEPGAGTYPKKLVTCTFRDPKDEEEDFVKQAINLYEELKDAPAPQPQAQSASSQEDEEEDF